jgi:hypothetical protein
MGQPLAANGVEARGSDDGGCKSRPRWTSKSDVAEARMTEDMQVRNLSPHAQTSYVQQVCALVRNGNANRTRNPDRVPVYRGDSELPRIRGSEIRQKSAEGGPLHSGRQAVDGSGHPAVLREDRHNNSQIGHRTTMRL